MEFNELPTLAANFIAKFELSQLSALHIVLPLILAFGILYLISATRTALRARKTRLMTAAAHNSADDTWQAGEQAGDAVPDRGHSREFASRRSVLSTTMKSEFIDIELA